jgi:hypothetical protein
VGRVRLEGRRVTGSECGYGYVQEFTHKNGLLYLKMLFVLKSLV